ncbi:DUF6318 family protein [Nesterenkonia sandarakina]|uniref:DUF6318 domain-containing protein n=1 Tax=Nesterenkonia sandarakina TaxID=272918 RepID=A0A2T0YK52_9MICC|nr:DUF6318 family protein [Nesterenkonia sandarakina]PRZ15586.1 hypothetical protein BCL67_10846 [Nesterenkonia sandarakina]
MNTSAGRLGVVSVAAVLGLVLSSCGGDDAGAEPAGAEGAPSAEQPSPDGEVSEPEPEQSSGDGGETEEPESSPTPVPASSDGPAQNWPEPEVPDEIYEETEEGALAALRYWFEASTYLQLTGQSQPLEELSGSECVMCAQRALQAEQVYEEDEGWFATSGVDVVDPIVSAITQEQEASVLFTLNEGATQRFNSDGTIAAEVEEAAVPGMEAVLVFGDAHWEVAEVYLPEARGE